MSIIMLITAYVQAEQHVAITSRVCLFAWVLDFEFSSFIQNGVALKSSVELSVKQRI